MRIQTQHRILLLIFIAGLLAIAAWVNFSPDNTPAESGSVDVTEPASIQENTLDRTAPLTADLIADPVPDQTIIRFIPDSTRTEREAYLARLDATVIRWIDALDTAVIASPEQALLLRDPDVVALHQPDYYVQAMADIPNPPNDPYYSEQWSLAAMEIPDAWQSLPGDLTTQTVAIIDSGICLSHPDLSPQIGAGYDFVEQDDFPQDESGHGCAVAGVLAASINNSTGIAGMVPDINLMPLRVLDANNTGTYSDVAAAIVYAVDHGADLITLSLGGINPSSILESAAIYAEQNGVRMIAAAGNTSGDVLYPARYDNVIAVGALDEYLSQAPYSATGADVDTWAPGSNIVTLSRPDSYIITSGTSLAAAHVTGKILLDHDMSALDQSCNLEAVNVLESHLQDLLASGATTSDATVQQAALDFIVASGDCYENPSTEHEGTIRFIDDGAMPLPGFDVSGQYELFDTKWGEFSPYDTSSPPGVYGGTVTYSFMPSGLDMNLEQSGYGSSQAISSLNGYQACFITEIETAFAAWSAVANIDFERVDEVGFVQFGSNGDVGDIRIGAHDFPANSQTLAHAYAPPAFGENIAGDMHFNTAWDWTCAFPDENTFDIGIVALHEIGHSIGLDHEMLNYAVMNPVYDPALSSLQNDDINGIQAVYGIRLTNQPPPNDDFDNAFLTNENSVNTTTATDAIDDPVPSCGQNTANTVWYSFTYPEYALIDVATIGSDYDTVLSVWEGTRGNLTEVACNDDLGSTTTDSQVIFLVEPGTTYYMMVSGDNGATGNLLYTVFGGVPANNSLFAPKIIDPIPYNDQTVTTLATIQNGEPLPTCGDAVDHTVWYELSPDRSGVYIFDTTGSNFDTVIMVWANQVGGDVIGCNNDTNGTTSQLQLDLETGTTYYIMAGGNQSTTGFLNFNVTFSIRGDCNADFIIDAGDLSALQLELNDSDTASTFGDISAGFDGNPTGCDANASTIIDESDLSCIQQLIFSPDLACTP